MGSVLYFIVKVRGKEKRIRAILPYRGIRKGTVPPFPYLDRSPGGKSLFNGNDQLVSWL